VASDTFLIDEGLNMLEVGDGWFLGIPFLAATKRETAACGSDGKAQKYIGFFDRGHQATFCEKTPLVMRTAGESHGEHRSSDLKTIGFCPPDLETSRVENWDAERPFAALGRDLRAKLLDRSVKTPKDSCLSCRYELKR
jgi:hypothetical protein